MRLPRNSRRIAAALPLVIAWVLAITATASADQTFTVNRLTDDGDGVCDSTCTLRDAVSSANVLPGNDTVVLPAGTLQLSLSGADETTTTAVTSTSPTTRRFAGRERRPPRCSRRLAGSASST